MIRSVLSITYLTSDSLSDLDSGFSLARYLRSTLDPALFGIHAGTYSDLLSDLLLIICSICSGTLC